MARLLNYPVGLPVVGREPLSGPRAVGASGTQTIGGFVQTTAAPFGLWRWRFTLKNIRGQAARRYRGWITALHGGANATRVPFCDWDGLTASQAGVDSYGETNWSDGQPWSTGLGWQAHAPEVAIAAVASRGDTTVTLADEYWGYNLDMGDQIGFFPFYFGMHMVTEALGDGVYRIWPPLRKDLVMGDSATLKPVLAMRLEGEDSATAPRDAAFITGASVTLIEVPHYDVETYFAD